jgi:transposase
MNHYVPDFVPITEAAIDELREQSRSPGLSAEQTRVLIRELERTERERGRMAREVESMRASRVAIRETLLQDLTETRKLLAEKDSRARIQDSRIAELEKQLQLAQALVDGAVV